MIKPIIDIYKVLLLILMEFMWELSTDRILEETSVNSCWIGIVSSMNIL